MFYPPLIEGKTTSVDCGSIIVPASARRPFKVMTLGTSSGTFSAFKAWQLLLYPLKPIDEAIRYALKARDSESAA